ncbi:phenylacetate--CoA ligase family protein [Gordonia alkanivorans]|uniref:phenylacetate--CoA ligase family protein n=1 Tax=Gordonia alkanivorans TaxID=84096 RepID=UPI001F4E69CD|nr:hypothetical protein [Gordonia alkanivorans]
MLDGDIALADTWSSTSGSTGKPTFFPRNQEALDDAAYFYRRIFDECFEIGNHSTLFVVCFAMGTWIGGTYSHQAGHGLHRLGYRVSVTTPGIDVGAAVTNVAELGPHYEKVVIAGYPPLVKDVLDQMPDAALAQDICILLAGEGIAEEWRSHLLERIGRRESERVCLIYGTAEAGVMGHETPLTVAVRRAARTDSTLQSKLFGGAGTLPTFVQVDPQRRYAEVDEEGYLLFTIDGALPLIRYRINDQGDVWDGQRLRNALAECGRGDLASRVDSDGCFVVLTGRPDVATTFYSSNIYPSQIAPAFDDPSVTRLVTGKFCADGSPGEDHRPVLRIDVELSAGTRTAPADLADALVDLCRTELLRNNDEFRTLSAEHDDDRTTPRVTLHLYGTGPFRPGIKHNYVGGTK